MFTFSGLSSRNRFNPWVPKPTFRYSLTNRWFFRPPLNFTPQIPQFLTPNYTTIDPFGLNRLTNLRQPPVDLELRLGQVGHTISYQEAMRTKWGSSKTNYRVPMGRVSKKLALTLGHRTWLSSYIRRGRPIGSRNRTRRSDLANKNGAKHRHDCNGPIDLDLNKEVGGDDESVGSAGPTSGNRKRDYYGPCVRCGRVFDISQRYASHMRLHYQMDETEEERMVRLARRRRRN